MASETEAKKLVRLSRDIHLPLFIQAKSRTKVTFYSHPVSNCLPEDRILWSLLTHLPVSSCLPANSILLPVLTHLPVSSGLLTPSAYSILLVCSQSIFWPTASPTSKYLPLPRLLLTFLVNIQVSSGLHPLLASIHRLAPRIPPQSISTNLLNLFVCYFRKTRRKNFAKMPNENFSCKP